MPSAPEAAVFRLRKPGSAFLADFLDRQRGQEPSYPEVGASEGGDVLALQAAGYTVDQYRVRLGAGADAWEAARRAMEEWTMFDLGWVRLTPDGPLRVGANLAVLVRLFPLWSVNASRVMYLLDESGGPPTSPRRWSIGYGTLRDHAESGEERFSAILETDGSVWYEVFAFSRPRHPLARLGAPVTRLLQKRFARDSVRAMAKAVARSAARAP